MASEAVYATMVTVGITGAGLVLAIYALIIPISGKLFSNRARLVQKQIEQFEKQRNELTPDASTKEFKRLQQLSVDIKTTKNFPKFLSVGVLATFVSYMFLCIFSFGALWNPLNRTPENDFFLMIIFAIANTAFLVLGILVTASTSSTMKKEYEKIKDELSKSVEKLPTE